MSYLLAFLGFVALIVLHELGHFLAAKAVGMRVERFSLFFGPLLVKFRRGETEYGIGPIPLGGYVKITGMTPNEQLPPDVEPRAYYNQPVWKRIVVIAAGPAMNLLIAFVIVWAVFLHVGQSVATTKVAQVVTPSASAGKLMPGDDLQSVNGVGGSEAAIRAAIGNDRCVGTAVNGCAGAAPLRVVVRRNGRLLTLSITPRYSSSERRMLIGIAFGSRQAPVSAAHAASLGITNLWGVTKLTLSAVAKIFEPKERQQLSGVVGVYTVTQESFAHDTTQAFWVLALISLSLAIINLFPFLPLDGGHIFWALAEKIRGKRIPFSVIERASVVGFVLILLLFVIGLSNDISKLSGAGFNVH